MADETSETELTHHHPLVLEVMVPGREPYRVALAGRSSIVIGRSRSADVQVEHRSVSREHARIALGARLELTDLGSGNGTRVRGRDVEAQRTMQISIGELVEIGSAAISVLALRGGDGGGQRRSPGDATLVAASGAMRAIVDTIERVAPSEASVLLVGEAGVGKEVCARLLHQRSARAARGFVRADARQLLGGERAAIEDARGGTVMLDGIEALSPSLQLALLHVLDRRELPRCEARGAVAIDARFVASARCSLAAEVDAGRFREDLYYRIAGVPIEVPPLRARIEDIVPLASHLLAQAARRRGRGDLRLTSEIAAVLVRHAWPGNVGELRDVIEHAVAVCGDGPLRREQFVLGEEVRGGLADEVEDLERRRVDAALIATGGNQSEAARRLGMSRGALLARLRAWGAPSRRE